MSNNNNNSSHHYDHPPNHNPLLNAYDSFHRDTPAVTRYILTTQAFSWALSFFVDWTFGLANIPVFTVQHYEVYRLVTSLLVCTNLFSLILAYMSFVDTGRRLEQAMGSTPFAILVVAMGVFTNSLYVAVAACLDVILGTQHWYYLPTFGIWLVLFGLIAMECSKAPQGTRRRLFFCHVPTLYYPLAVLAVFSLLSSGGFNLGYLISIGVGYAYGYGWLDWAKISSNRCSAWEEQLLEPLTQTDGWVLANAALGSTAWSEALAQQQQQQEGMGGGLQNIFSQWTQQAQQSHDGSNATSTTAIPLGEPGDARPGRVIKPSPGASGSAVSTESSSSIPTTGGRQLGGSSSSQRIDPRQARLHAIQRRMGGNV
jgi:membrane associated rhomboid family serine protease